MFKELGACSVFFECSGMVDRHNHCSNKYHLALPLSGSYVLEFHVGVFDPSNEWM